MSFFHPPFVILDKSLLTSGFFFFWRSSSLLGSPLAAAMLQLLYIRVHYIKLYNIATSMEDSRRFGNISAFI